MYDSQKYFLKGVFAEDIMNAFHSVNIFLQREWIS